MAKLLVTAFEPFGTWKSNSSQLCLTQFVQQIPSDWNVTARVYPVEFETTRPLLESDLMQEYDFSLHLGQTQQTARIRFEALGLNLGAVPGKPEGEVFPLNHNGPAAYQCGLPLSDWAAALRELGIPATVSFHAGTYLCNATLYWGHHLIHQHRLKTESCFVHVPLDISQVVNQSGDFYTLPTALVVQSLLHLLEFWKARNSEKYKLA